jgi:glycosyltransferase involved in cell wall biosynthesis
MKILLIHSYYQLSGGEDSVFEQECDLLSTEHEVKKLSFQNKSGLAGALQFIMSIWNIIAARKVRNTVNEFKPDIIHLHNWHFASGPIIIRTARKLGVPIVLTLHNYRLLCPSATLLHKSQIFTNSLKASFPWQAINNKVYRNSSLLTFWLALVIWFHKIIGTWKLVDKYIALTPFAKELLLNSSFYKHVVQVDVKPNFVEQPVRSISAKQVFFVFVGRLSEEKGLRILLDTFKSSQHKLIIIGDGPLAQEVKQACSINQNIEWLGALQKQKVLKILEQATAMIFPSICYEGMPMTILEAFSVGTPIIASKIGAMTSLIDDGCTGYHFETGNSESLLDKINSWQSLTDLQRDNYSNNAMRVYNQNYRPEPNLDKLSTIYRLLLKG